MVNTDNLRQQFKERFGAAAEVVTASPGRIEFIGNHTDYNGGQVLGVALDREVRVAAGPRSDEKLCFASEGEVDFEGSADTLVAREGELAWVNYPLGILQVVR
ncbi:MAG: galactokinase, partial [Verrucomicrobia bacterium]|nr:galactokinase [Verrucomicrobiota bacterium]